MAIAFAVFIVSVLWQFGTKRKQSAINSNKVRNHQYPNSVIVPMHALLHNAKTRTMYEIRLSCLKVKMWGFPPVSRSLSCLAGCYCAVSSQAHCCHHAHLAASFSVSAVSGNTL